MSDLVKRFGQGVEMTGRTLEPKAKQGGSTGTGVLARLVRPFQFQFCFKDSLAFPSHIPGWLLPSSPVLSGRCWDGFSFGKLQPASLQKACGSLAVWDLGLLTSLKAWLDGAARIGSSVSPELKGSCCALKRLFTNAQDPGASGEHNISS